LLVFSVGIYFLLSHYFSDVEINKYDTVDAVKEQKAIQSGWIPKNIPPSAYDIAETHDLDINLIVGKFSYKERDENTFLESLKKSNDIYEAEGFLFKVNKELNLVNFRNVPSLD